MPNRKPTQSWADLSVPIRPSGVPYKDGEDYDAQALLVENGYEIETPTLIKLLDAGFQLNVLQSAAARVLGVKGERSAIGALENLANNKAVDETVRVQAAFALARMGVETGKPILIELVAFNPEASPAPLQAAGALAALGDMRGFEVVSKALDSTNRVTAMIACKQLINFRDVADVYEAYSRALSRPEQNIQGEARAQLAQLDTQKAHALLKKYPPQN